jgi:hypothetical protein
MGRSPRIGRRPGTSEHHPPEPGLTEEKAAVNTHGIALINNKEAGLLPTSGLNNMAASCQVRLSLTSKHCRPSSIEGGAAEIQFDHVL